MAQQGSPPRRPSRQPDPEHRGSGERPDRQQRPAQDGPAQDRGRRAERPDRAGWQAYEAFGPEEDAELPPWAPPSSYQQRPGGSRLRLTAQRGGRVKDRYDDPYADQYAEPDRAYQDRGNQGANQDGALEDGAYEDGAYEDGAYRDGGHRGGAHESDGREGTVGEGERYRGRRRGPDPLAGTSVDAEGEPAENDDEPDAPPHGRRSSRRKGRAAATRLRKSRRRIYRWSGIAIVIVLLAAGGVWLFGRSTPARTPWVTRLLAGEYKSVPNACTAVSATVLNAYLPASGRTERVSVGSGTDSQCGYTFDRQPTFLVLQLGAQALQPFAAAGNNGSATANAELAFATARQALARPPKRSPLPSAVITPLAGLGEQAIIAIQHEHVTGIGTDVVTIVLRQRNVLLTVAVSGQESGHGFGPVPDATLTACARAAAAGLLAEAERQPTA